MAGCRIENEQWCPQPRPPVEFAGSNNPGEGDCAAPRVFLDRPHRVLSSERREAPGLGVGHSPTWGAGGTVRGEFSAYLRTFLLVCAHLLLVFWTARKFTICNTCRIKVQLGMLRFKNSPTVP